VNDAAMASISQFVVAHFVNDAAMASISQFVVGYGKMK